MVRRCLEVIEQTCGGKDKTTCAGREDGLNFFGAVDYEVLHLLGKILCVVWRWSANEKVIELGAVVNCGCWLDVQISCGHDWFHCGANVVEGDLGSGHFVDYVFREVVDNHIVVDGGEDVHGTDHVEGLEWDEEEADADFSLSHLLWWLGRSVGVLT